MRHLPLILLGGIALFILVVWLALGAPESAGDDPGRLIYLLAVLAVLTFWWGSSRGAWRELGRDLRYLLVWGAILLGLVAVYGLRDDFTHVWRNTLAELRPGQAVSAGDTEVMLAADADGHFRVRARVNGVPVAMMVDTGASDVALTRADARRAGIDVDALTYDRPYVTANGVALSAVVTLDSVRVGDIEVRNVRASVGGTELSNSLLGMSFLRRLSAVEMTPSRLVLRQ